jgi:hypothetical protein
MKDMVVRLSDGADIALRRAEPKDLPSIVDLLADDPLGITREGTDAAYGPYEGAFEDISADPRQLLVVAVDEEEIVGTLQLTFDKSRVDAHRFYERLGFAATHEGFKMSL